MSEGIPAEARTAIDSYLARLDEVLPGACEGAYLTGSVALDDWCPGRSDLDVLTVTTRRLTAAALEAVAGLHSQLASQPHLDAIYVGAEQIGRRPADGNPSLPHSVNGTFSPDGYRPDPVLWATLHRCGVTVRGKPAQDLDAVPDATWLREWNLDNLTSYWQPWAAQARAVLGQRDPAALCNAEATAHGLLGPGRLHYTITTGGLLAKTDAADYTARHFAGFTELLANAKAWRLGDDSVTFTTADGLATCDLVEAVANDAARSILQG